MGAFVEVDATAFVAVFIAEAGEFVGEEEDEGGGGTVGGGEAVDECSVISLSGQHFLAGE